MFKKNFREHLNSYQEQHPIYAPHQKIYESYQQRGIMQNITRDIKKGAEKGIKEAITESLNSK